MECIDGTLERIYSRTHSVRAEEFYRAIDRLGVSKSAASQRFKMLRGNWSKNYSGPKTALGNETTPGRLTTDRFLIDYLKNLLMDERKSCSGIGGLTCHVVLYTCSDALHLVPHFWQSSEEEHSPLSHSAPKSLTAECCIRAISIA